MIKLLDIGEIAPSTYNPRKSDAKRLDYLEISLRKMGFVLPIVATVKGEILSGHQRHFVATRMGAKKVPVLVTKDYDLEKRKGLNILFNRATNDMRLVDTERNLTERLTSLNMESMMAAVPDLAADTDDFFPCMRAEMVPAQLLIDRNPPEMLDENMVGAGKRLLDQGIEMPIVAARESGRVVNGLGRMFAMLERGDKVLPVVWVTEAQAGLAHVLLNFLTMDFDIHSRYTNELRYNSFRRATGTRDHIGVGFTFAVKPGERANAFDYKSKADILKWVRVHGSSVVDFGAGKMDETRMIRAMGVKCYPFEPYRLDPGTSEINRDLAVETAREFLQAVGDGVRFSSVFISAVLNSVPFRADREKVLQILAALCDERSICYSCSIADDNGDFKIRTGQVKVAQKDRARTSQFELSYEKNITIGEFTGKPKVQKYHSLEEWDELFRTAFQEVRSFRPMRGYVAAVCRKPFPVDPAKLREALEFEFELPYPDGKTMGLSQEAKAAFGRRHGIEL